MAKRSADKHRRPPAASRAADTGTRLALAGVALAALVAPMAFLDTGTNPFGPLKALLVALGALIALAGVLAGRPLSACAARVLRSSQGAWAAGGLLALLAVATAASPWPRLALFGAYPDFRGLTLAIAAAALALAAAALAADGRITVALAGRGATVALGWLGIVALAERAGLPPATFKLPGAVRAISAAGNASNLGAVVLALAPLVIHAALSERSRPWRFAAIAAAAGGGLALVWSMSRGAWIAALVLLVVFGALAALRRGSFDTQRVVLVAGAVCVAALLAVASVPQVGPRAARLLDTASSTAQWRLGAWRSAAELTAQRPLLGAGPATFRVAYLPYKQPGADDGRLGYVPAEAAHNLVLDTAASGGVGAVALVAWLVVAAGLALVRLARGGRPVEALAVAAALGGPAIALQLHYLTLDSAALLAALVGLALGLDPAIASAAAPSPRATRATRIGIGFALVPVAAVALNAALVWIALSTGNPRLAPLEPAVQRAAARATIGAQLDDARLTETLAAYDAAVRLSPGDPDPVLERAAFLLQAGTESRNPQLIRRARDGFTAAAELDAASGVPLLGLARTQLLLGDASTARTTAEKGLGLSPQSAEGWKTLSVIARELGDDATAASAARRAEELAPAR